MTAGAAAPSTRSESADRLSDTLPRVTGLGKAVIRPPPGYDPSDPLGKRKKKEAPEHQGGSASRPAWSSMPPPKVPPKSLRDDRRDRPRGKPRRKGRRSGRIEMIMDDVRVDTRRRRRTRRSAQKKASPQPKAQKRRIQVDQSISVAQLAHEMSVKASQLIKELIGLGQPATINEVLDFETAKLVASAFEYDIVDVAFHEQQHMIQLDEDNDQREIRPVIVTIMGHVDHGKTTLLDKIRRTNVVAGEAGGITQHISAYQVEHDGDLITFIDTPGHAAFTEMRARGANLTDIVVLVVAADDGVMPQTIECINHTRAANVPMIVAVNKCDKPGVKPEIIRQRIMEHGLVPEEYGGDTQVVDISALTGEGIPDLLDAIKLQAELYEFKANSNRHAEGIVLEARLERGRGPVAVLVLKDGTLKRGDRIVAGTAFGRVRAMMDFNGRSIKKAGPSTPVEIMGLNEVPTAGDIFTVVGSDKDAKALSLHRAEEARKQAFGKRHKVTLEDLFQRAGEQETRTLNLVVKADVHGTVGAIESALGELEVEGVSLKILHSGVGAISESDITLAGAYGAVVIGFNVRPDPKARKAAEQQGVDIRKYRVIYELVDEVERAMTGLLEPIIQEKYFGTAEVRDTFSIPKVGTIAGCYVSDGRVARNARVRLTRDGTIVWEGRMSSLRRFKDDVREVQKGLECGIGLDGFNDVKIGDSIECFNLEKIARG